MVGRQICSKPSLKSRPVGADASNRRSTALLIKVHELCEQDEIVPAALCTTFYWCADKQSCSPVHVPAALVAPLEMLMFPKALPASSNLPGNKTCNQMYWCPVFKTYLRHFFSPAHKL